MPVLEVNMEAAGYEPERDVIRAIPL